MFGVPIRQQLKLENQKFFGSFFQKRTSFRSCQSPPVQSLPRGGARVAADIAHNICNPIAAVRLQGPTAFAACRMEQKAMGDGRHMNNREGWMRIRPGKHIKGAQVGPRRHGRPW